MNVCIALIFVCVSGINSSSTSKPQNGTTLASEMTPGTSATLGTLESSKRTSEIGGNFTTRSALYLEGEGDYARAKNYSK